MSDPVVDAGVQVGLDVTVAKANPAATTPPAPVSFADTPYDVLADVTLGEDRVLKAGSTTTPADMGLADDIPAVHALVVAGSIWPTGVEH